MGARRTLPEEGRSGLKRRCGRLIAVRSVYFEIDDTLVRGEIRIGVNPLAPCEISNGRRGLRA